MAAAGEPFLRDRAGAGRLPTPFDNDRRCGMSQLDLVDNDVPQTHENAASSASVPALHVTAGQPEPIAAHDGRYSLALAPKYAPGPRKAIANDPWPIAHGRTRERR